MKHGSLFSGIGGFDLAAEWMGWENVFHCEWNEFGQKVLNYYWPNAKSYGDITKTDFNVWRGKVDVLSGGFPCQPYSLAGKRKGKEDERHLWPEMLRAIREIQPRWVVGENVLGLVNWSGGLVFHEVQTDLEAAGYEVFPYVLPACSTNAPHRRDRVWFVAYRSGIRQHTWRPEQSLPGCGTNGKERTAPNPNNQRRNDRCDNREERHIQASTERRVQKDKSERNGWEFGISEKFNNGDATDTECFRSSGEKYGQKKSGLNTEKNTGCGWQNFPTQPPICSGNDGIPSKLDGITFSKWRNESIKAAGNAIVPQVVYQIFKSIEEYEILTNTTTVK